MSGIPAWCHIAVIILLLAILVHFDCLDMQDCSKCNQYAHSMIGRQLEESSWLRQRARTVTTSAIFGANHETISRMNLSQRSLCIIPTRFQKQNASNSKQAA